MLRNDIAWSQIIGTRSSQQDSAGIISWPNGFKLLLLADGMGGHTGGDIASSLAVEVFRNHFIQSEQPDIRKRMIEALTAVNLGIYQKVKETPDLSGMGTTLIAVAFDGLSIQWLSVGDSPLWLIRDGNIKRINQNHSMSVILAEKVAAGEISQEEANTSPDRSQLLEAVMGEDIKMVDAPEDSFLLAEGDCLILASDGVESCGNDEILNLTNDKLMGAEQLTKAILNAVSDVGKRSQDNASLVVMKLYKNYEDEIITAQPKGKDLINEPRTI